MQNVIQMYSLKGHTKLAFFLVNWVARY